MLLGSTAYTTSGHARCPVIVRDGRAEPPGPQRPVVVGSDRSMSGDPAVAEAAGLVVLGSRGHGLLSGVVLGSTSRSVLHHTRTLVMVVH